jgi:hypothetical protein
LSTLLPVDEWKASSIQDENTMGPEYFEELKAKEVKHKLNEILGTHK